MKRSVSVLLTFMLVMPAFAPWVSHGAMHALHDSHIAAHHGSDQHNHHSYEHHYQHKADLLHSLHLDFVSYFKDYLHVDLSKPEHGGIDFASADLQDFDPPLDIAFYSKLSRSISFHSRAPPDYSELWPAKLPLYLSTQRLRI